jgi:hypothetical protein
MRRGRSRFAPPLAPLRAPVTCVPPLGDPRPPAPAHGRPSIAPAASASHRGGPDAVGVAVTRVASPALGASPGEARNGHRMAPPRLSPVLDLDEPTPHRTSKRTEGRARPHSRALITESALGCATDSWRATEAGHLGQSIHRRQVHATPPDPALAILAHVPHQSCRPKSWPRTSSPCRPSRSACCLYFVVLDPRV